MFWFCSINISIKLIGTPVDVSIKLVKAITDECIDQQLYQCRAIATGTAGMAMAIPLFGKVTNKYGRLLSLQLHLPCSMYCIHTYRHYKATFSYHLLAYSTAQRQLDTCKQLTCIPSK